MPCPASASSELTEPSRPAAVVFDCDGVLIESVEIKTEAFVALYPDHPEHHPAIVEHHQRHLGASRFEKFRWIEERLFGRAPDRERLQELGAAFSRLVFERARECPEVQGTTELLDLLEQLRIPRFIASGIPEEELVRLVTARGWAGRFAGIHGSPRHKEPILRAIAAELDAEPEALLFLGDGRTDYDAALATGAAFCLRDTPEQADRFSDYNGLRLSDLTGFAALFPWATGEGGRTPLD